MDHDTSAQDGGTDPAGGPDDAKARFRAALERKQQQNRRSVDGRRNTGAVHGPEVTGGGRRSFRRKTG